jgi:hypothetical protein
MRSPRLAAAALGVLALTACATGGTTPSPTSAASASPTADTISLKTASGTGPLKVRHIPQTTGLELAKIPSGSAIIVDCQVKGASVAGTQGSTTAWDHLSYQGVSGYVSAAYVEGGAASTIPTCPYSASIATTPRPMPTSVATDAAASAVAIATSQLGVATDVRRCSPYSAKCEDWGAHFAAWVWQKAGVEISDASYSLALYQWGVKNKRAHEGVAGVGPGDLIFTGTGPTSKGASRVDVVVAAFSDHLHVIGGAVDSRVTERDIPLTGLYGWVSIT